MSNRIMVIADAGGPAHYHVGDEAILTARLAWLRTVAPPLTPVVLSNDPAFTAKRHGVAALRTPRLPPWVHGRGRAGWLRHPRLMAGVLRHTARVHAPDLYAVIDMLRQCSLLYVCGGGNLTSLYGGLLHVRSFLAECAQREGVPIVLTGQQIGAYLTSDDAAILHRWLPGAVGVGVRDRGHSVEWAHRLGVDASRLLVTGDDALDLVPETVPGWTTPAAGERPRVGLSLHHQGGAQTRAATIARLAAALGPWLKHSAADIVVLPHVRADVHHRCDVRLAEDLLAILGLGDRARIVDRDAGRDTQLKYLTGLCDFVVTTRFHGAVFALSSGVPAALISQDEYTAGRFAGLLDFLRLPVSILPLDAGDLSARVDAAWHERATRREEVCRAWAQALPRFHTTRETVRRWIAECVVRR